MTENYSSDRHFRDFTGVGRDVNSGGGDVKITFVSQQADNAIRDRPLKTGSPYMGLSKFEAKDKDKFFGRDRWIIELIDDLEQNRVLLLLGASGSGKSSLIQAGLIPALEDRWGSEKLVILTFVPDVNPFESFYICLANRYSQSQAKLAQTVQENTLIEVVRSLKEDSRWLIFIDQFEELFTRTPKKERDIFVKSLMQLINQKDDSMQIVLTMRADFLDRLSPYPDLGKVHDRYSRMLADMDDSELKLAIAEPAARNGVLFEAGLIDQIIADFHQQAGSLPLLQYTLNLLWENDDIQDRILNIKTYQDIGGVTGALQQQANKIYDRLDEQQRQAAEQIFLELIELAGKEPVSRRADKSSLEREEKQKEVLERLIENRLLTSQREGEKATVEVAHEELLRSWKVLQDLIREKEEIIVLRNRLDADAKQWHELRQHNAQQAMGELWSGSKLARIVEFKNNGSLPNLDAVAIKFIQASVARAERQKNEKIRMAWGIAVGSLVAVAVSSGLGLMAWNKTKEAELNQAESLARYSLALLNEGKDLDASIEAIKAGKILQKHNKTKPPAPEVMRALIANIYEGRERDRLESHEDGVYSVTFSPDGKTLASGSDDNTIKLWDVETGEEIRILHGHGDRVSSVSFSADGQTLASGSHDKTIKLWDVETGEEIHTFNGHGGFANSVSFSPDGQTLASGSYDKAIKLWDVETGEEIHTFNGHESEVNSVNFSPDGKTLASGSHDKAIKLWDVETGEEIRTLAGHKFGVNGVKFSSDGKTLASGEGNSSIKLWDVETGEEIRTLDGHKESVNSIKFSPDGKTLASGSHDKTIKLWDVKTGAEIRSFNGHEEFVSSVSFSPDGKTLASGSYDKAIKLWNLETREKIRTPIHYEESVWSIKFSPDGKTLASGSQDSTIKLWNLETREKIRTLNGHEESVSSVSFSPDGKTLASGSEDKTIKLWDVGKKTEITTLRGHNSYVLSVNFSPDGKTLASGSGDKTIKLWDVKTGAEIANLQVHDGYVYSVSFSPDGKTLASGSGDKTIKLWDVKTGAKIHTLNGHEQLVTSVQFSPDGKTLASGSHDKAIKLWDVKTGVEIYTLNGHEAWTDSVQFSPNGKTLASGSGDKTIKLWDVKTGAEIYTLNGHNSWVISVKFRADGKTLASGSTDNTIKLWDVGLEALIERGCDRIRNYLTYNPNVSEEDKRLCDGK